MLFRKAITKILAALFISLLPLYYVNGQEVEADSLIHELTFMSEDTNKVTTYNIIAQSYLRINPNYSIKYAQKGLELASILEYECGIAHLQKSLGNAYYTQGRYEEAINSYTLSLSMFEKENDELNIARLYNNLGNLYVEKENYSEGKKYYNQAYDILDKLNDFNGKASILMNIGVQYDERTEYDSALMYYDQALAVSKELKDQELEALTLHNIGYSYKQINQLDRSKEYFEESLRLSEDINDNSTRINSLIGLAEVEMMKGNTNRTLNLLIESESLSESFGLRPLLSETYRLKSNALELKGDHKNALEYFQKYKVLEDSLKTIESDKALFELMAKNEMLIREKEIEALNLQNETKTQKLKASQLENIILLLFSGFTLIFLLIVAYYFKNRHKSTLQLAAQNRQILDQKEAIEKQKKELDIINMELSSLNTSLQDKNIKLRQLNKEKDYLMNVVAHDLKSPLNQITGLVNLVSLSKGKLDDEQKLYLEKIEMVSSRLSNLVNKILDIESFTKDSKNLELVDLDLVDVLKQIMEEFQTTANEKNINLKSNLNGNSIPVKGDKEHVHQIFSNLVSNALKFSPPRTEVFVNLEEGDNKVITEVKDQGPGLNEDDMKKVFKKFAKLSAQPTGNEASSGLGLSIVKKYVEAMNGKVWVENENGGGAIFKVELKKA